MSDLHDNCGEDCTESRIDPEILVHGAETSYSWEVSKDYNVYLEPDSKLTLDRWADIVNKWAERKGWNKDRLPGDQFANFHSEISEAWEEYRHGHKWTEVYYNFDLCNCGVPTDHIDTLALHTPGCPATKPEGIPIELADCVIRILHTCGYYGIDLESMIKLKMMYNETREVRHGGKLA